MFYLNARIIL